MLSARYRVLGAVAGACGLAVIGLNDPATSEIFPPCVFLSLTGFECPGCGSTRCLHQILNGNLREAFDLNMLTVIALPWVLWRFGRWLLGRPITHSRVDYRVIAMVGVVVVTFGVLRNTDIASLAFLAATEQ